VDVIRRDRKDTKIMRPDKELYPVLGDRPMREVRAADVQRIVFDKRDHGFPAATGDIRNMCKRMWDYCQFQRNCLSPKNVLCERCSDSLTVATTPEMGGSNA
jgi:hypothetical protein